MLIHLILPMVAIPTTSMRAVMNLGAGLMDPSMALEIGLTGDSLAACGTGIALDGRRSQSQRSRSVAGSVGSSWGLYRRSHLDVAAWGRELVFVIIAMIIGSDVVGDISEGAHHGE